jgi:hypothetical protein
MTYLLLQKVLPLEERACNGEAATAPHNLSVLLAYYISAVKSIVTVRIKMLYYY